MNKPSRAPVKDRQLAQDVPVAVKRTWIEPTITDLPRLVDLTLQTGGSIPGECELGGGGSTCF